DTAILTVGGRAHELSRLLARVFLEGDPRRNRKHLFFRPVRPVGLVRSLECGAQRLDSLDFPFGAREIAAARHSETARETNERIGLRIHVEGPARSPPARR